MVPANVASAGSSSSIATTPLGLLAPDAPPLLVALTRYWYVFPTATLVSRNMVWVGVPTCVNVPAPFTARSTT